MIIDTTETKIERQIRIDQENRDIFAPLIEINMDRLYDVFHPLIDKVNKSPKLSSLFPNCIEPQLDFRRETTGPPVTLWISVLSGPKKWRLDYMGMPLEKSDAIFVLDKCGIRSSGHPLAMDLLWSIISQCVI